LPSGQHRLTLTLGAMTWNGLIIMPFETKAITIMLGGPSDVQKFLSIVKEAVMEWNSLNSHQLKITFVTRDWKINPREFF
jgi:hypothetical protein